MPVRLFFTTVFILLMVMGNGMEHMTLPGKIYLDVLIII